jgi:hypothetical protein
MSHISRVLATRLAAALANRQWRCWGNTRVDVQMRRKPDYLLEDLGTMVVSVVPGPVTFETETRLMETAEVTVGIVIAKHVGSEADIAALEDFEQEILDTIRVGALVVTSVPAETDWTEIANPVPYDPESLETRNVFLGQVTVTYKVPLDRDLTLVEPATGPTG